MTQDRRTFLARAAAAAAGSAALMMPGVPAVLRPLFARPRPSPSQLLWQRDELALFLHFGVNTFTDREWGDGKESPSIFDPSALDARQWARTARAGGFRAVILTAKHHDGFCLWPTATTSHSVASSPFRGGQGDVVREFTDACKAEGLRVGLYLSPWDRNHPTYGDTPRYNDVYAAQLTELLTRYGPVHEVWFDGANGEGPNGKRQQYDWPRVWGLVRRLQPEAVMFSDAGPDVRWCGNERGIAGEPNWSTVDPAAVPHPGADGPHIIRALQHGDPNGTVWRPAEADTSIRPGWFYHPAEDTRVRSVGNLVELYAQSVGRNSKLLLNVPPTRAGLIHEADAANLAGMRTRLDAIYGRDLAPEISATWHGSERNATLDVTLPAEARFDTTRLRERIQGGQRVSAYAVQAQIAGTWREIARGTTIGYSKIDRFEPVTARRLRVVVEDAVERPERLTLSLHASGTA